MIGKIDPRRTALVDGGDLPPILDAAQVADLLGMNVQMVRKYARQGRLPAYKLPGARKLRFFRDEIFEFLRNHPAVVEGEEEVVIREEA
jgi:excisionase family DNA binding protein